MESGVSIVCPPTHKTTHVSPTTWTSPLLWPGNRSL